MEKRKMDPRIVKYFLLAALLVLGIRYFNVLLGGAGDLWSIASPLIAGCAVAYVLNIVMRRLEKFYFPRSESQLVRRSRRPVCIVLSLVLIAAVFYLILLLVVPELIKAFTIIGQSIPVAFRQLIGWLTENLDEFPQTAQMLEGLQNLNMDWDKLWNSALNYLRSGIGGFLNSTVTLVGSVVGGVVNALIALIFAIYILASKEKLADQFKRTVRAFVCPSWIEKCKRVLVTADRTFSSFIVGQVTEAVILGSLCTAGMLIFRFPYAPMIGAFIGATALIPIVGAYLGAAVGAFMILTQDPLKALLFIVFIVVLQQLEGNLIYPKVVGSSIGLPGMWVLAAVTIGGGLLGIPGMLLGVPSAATCYKLLGYGVNRRNARRQREKREAERAAGQSAGGK